MTNLIDNKVRTFKPRNKPCPTSQPYSGYIKLPGSNSKQKSSTVTNYIDVIDTCLRELEIKQTCHETLVETNPIVEAPTEQHVETSSQEMASSKYSSVDELPPKQKSHTYDEIIKNLASNMAKEKEQNHLSDYKSNLAEQIGEENVEDMIKLAKERYINSSAKLKLLSFLRSKRLQTAD